MIKDDPMRLAPADLGRDNDCFESGTDTEMIERLVKCRSVSEIGNHCRAIAALRPFENLKGLGPHFKRLL